VFVEDAERFIAEVRRRQLGLASYLWIEERELSRRRAELGRLMLRV
jgi:hypothetical protein